MLDHCNCRSDLIEVHHVVKNLHESNKLPFVWEGTNYAHKGLLPGDYYPRRPTMLKIFNPTQARGLIRYGTNLNLPWGPRREALIWIAVNGSDSTGSIEGVNCGAVPSTDAMLEKAELHPPEGDITDSLITSFEDANGTIHEVIVEIKSAYDGVIEYDIAIWPSDLAVAIGGFPTFWDKVEINYIETDVVLEPKFMYDILSESVLGMIPEQLVKEQLLLMPPHSSKLGISIRADAAQSQIVPVAVMDKGFQPLMTGSVKILVPEE